jgi:hypothetical protein
VIDKIEIKKTQARTLEQVTREWYEGDWAEFDKVSMRGSHEEKKEENNMPNNAIAR